MGLFKAIHPAARESVPKCTCCATAPDCNSDPATDNDGQNGPEDVPKGGSSGCICHGALVLSNLDRGGIELIDSPGLGSVPFDCYLSMQLWTKQNATEAVRHRTAPILSGSFVRISYQSLLI